MMTDVERRSGDTDLRLIAADSAAARRLVDMGAEAYPTMGLGTSAARDTAFAESVALAARQPERRRVAAFRDGTLVGGMFWYRLIMNVRGVQIPTSGLGSLAVALEQKRRGIARDCVAGFLDDAVETGAPIAALYAFRPDFYAKHGFAAGPKLDQYRISPAVLPDSPGRSRVRRLDAGDIDALDRLYERVQSRTHGLMKRERWRWDMRFASESHWTFGYDTGDELGGYFSYEVTLGPRGTWNRNAIVVLELLDESPAALSGLLGFLRSQSDQFGSIVFNTFDRDFHLLFSDARNGTDHSLFAPVVHETNTQGIGLMYRIVDPPGCFAQLAGASFGALDATVRFTLVETSPQPPLDPLVVRFERGRAQVADARARVDVDVVLSIADLTSLVMGTARFRSLAAYGRAGVSDAGWIDALDAAFVTMPPRCDTRF